MLSAVRKTTKTFLRVWSGGGRREGDITKKRGENLLNIQSLIYFRRIDKGKVFGIGECVFRIWRGWVVRMVESEI